MGATRLFISVGMLILGAQLGCSNDSASPGPVPDAGSVPECYEHPTTHEEILNGCTDAEKLQKNPVLPKLLPNGDLPPLP